MWRKESKQYEQDNINNIILFTGNHIEYGKAMNEVIDNWTFTMEHNLTNSSINKKAFIGHCAACFAYGYPEYLVRYAWWQLTEQQRVLADIEAVKAYNKWEQKKRLENILQHGKDGVILMDFPMKYL